MARSLVCSSMLLLAALITGCSNETDSSSDRQSAKKNRQEHKQSPSDADKKQPRSETDPSASNERQLSGGSQSQGSAESSPDESIDLAYLPDGYCAASVLHPSRLLDHPAVSPDMRGVVASAINDGLDEFLPMSEILPDVNSLEQAIVMADAQLLEMLLREASRSRYDDKEIEYDKKEVSNGELREFEEKGVETPEIDRQNDERGEGVRIDESDKIEINSNANGVPELDLPELPDVNPPRLDIRPDADDSSFTPQDASTRYVACLGAEEAGENEDVVKQLVDRARASRREWDRASRSVDDLQMIILGVHNYHDANRGLPPAYSVDKEGKPLLSWRVHLLPYIEQQSLYDQFKLDEPWDSDHNKKLIERMPPVFNSPGAKDTSGKTRYLATRCKNSVLQAPGRRTFAALTDGTSNTIAVVEADERAAVIWTKPQDYEIEKASFPEDLFGQRDSFLAAFADGHILLIAAPLEKSSFLSLCDGADETFPDYKTKPLSRIEGPVPGFLLKLRYRKPVDIAEEARQLLQQDQVESHDINGNTYYISRDSWRGCLATDERTLLVTLTANLPKILNSDPGSDDPLKNELRSVSGDNDFIAALVVSDQLRKQAAVLPAVLRESLPAELQSLAALPAALEAVSLQVNLSGDTLAQLQIKLNDQALANRLAATARKGIDLANMSLGLIKEKQRSTPAGDLVLGMGTDLLKNVSVEQSKSLIRLAVTAPVKFNDRVAVLMHEAKKAADEATKMNQLKRLGLGFHNHHDVYKMLPPAKKAEWYDKDGKPLLSWRVHLLYLIDEYSLYDQFKLDEPWDSEHNIKLLEQMPEIYRTSDSPTETSLMMVAGEGTAYEGKMGLSFYDFRDGLSNTILVVRAGTDKAVPWTKPEDLPFNPDDPIAAFGKIVDNGLMVLMGDGRVRRLPKDIAPATLRALLTRAGEDEASLSERTAEAFDVSGKVAYDGKPLSGGRIVFTNNEVEAFTSINPDGTYSLRGLAAGAYSVYFAEPDDKGESGSTLSAIPSKYRSPETSGLRIEVNSETSFDIVLQGR